MKNITPMAQKLTFRSPAKTASSLFLVGSLAMNVAQGVTTVGVYDESTTDENTGVAGIQNNSVDVSATVDVANRVSLATFSSSVLTAFNNNLGGVINFDNGLTGNFGSTISASYGTSQAKSINITNGVSNTWTAIASTSRTGISHPTNDTTGTILSISGNTGTATGPDFVFNFSVTDQVVMVGGTLLSRSGATNQTVTARVTFSNATTDSVVFTSAGANNGGNDTFAGFKAPTGFYITQFQFDLPTNEFRSVDDLGFITVPEPTSLAMIGLGAALVLRRRRSHLV